MKIKIRHIRNGFAVFFLNIVFLGAISPVALAEQSVREFHPDTSSLTGVKKLKWWNEIHDRSELLKEADGRKIFRHDDGRLFISFTDTRGNLWIIDICRWFPVVCSSDEG